MVSKSVIDKIYNNLIENEISDIDSDEDEVLLCINTPRDLQDLITFLDMQKKKSGGPKPCLSCKSVLGLLLANEKEHEYCHLKRKCSDQMSAKNNSPSKSENY